MAKRIPVPHRRLSPVVALILVIIVATLSYIPIFLGQLRQIDQRNTRLLETAARRIEEVIDVAGGNVASLSNDLPFACAFDDRQVFLELDNDTRCEDLGDLAPATLTAPRLRSDSEGLVFEVRSREPDSGPDVEDGAGPNGGSQGTVAYRFRVDVERILSEVPLDVFAGLLVADDQGRVTHSSRLEGGLRLQNMDPRQLLLRAGSAAREPQDESRDNADTRLSLDQLLAATRVFELPLANAQYRLFCQPLDLPRTDTTGGRFQASVLCGLSAAPSAVQEALLVSPELTLLLGFILIFGVIGSPLVRLALLKPQERFRLRDAYVLLLAVFAMLMVGTVALLDTEVYFDLSRKSEAALGALATDVETHLHDEFAAAYDQLRVFDHALIDGPDQSNPVPSPLPLMAHSGQDGCGKSSSVDLRMGVSELMACERKRLTARVARSRPDALLSGTHSLGPQRVNAESPVYPYYGSVFWMANDGWQLIKMTASQLNTPRVQLDRRPYFRSVTARQLWQVDDRHDAESASRRSFYVQPFRSITTGEQFTALSIRSQLTDCLRSSDPCGQPTPTTSVDAGAVVAAAISGEPLTITSPILPPGFGFAIVEPDGQVLYHSDNRRALDQNILDEVADRRRLEAAILSRSDRVFSSRYLARPHQLHVRPLQDLPWSLVTFHSDQELTTVNLEVVGHVLWFVGLYVLTVVTGLGLIVVVAPDKAELLVARLPPRSDWDGLYRVLAITYAVFGICALGALSAQSGDLLIGLSFLMWPAATAITMVSFSEWTRRTPPAQRRGERQDNSRPISYWYYGAAVLLWTLVAVVPAAGFFRSAWDDELRLLRRYEELHLASALEARACRIDTHYRELAEQQLQTREGGTVEEMDRHFDELRTRRHREVWDLYLNSTFVRHQRTDKAPNDAVTETMSRTSHWLARYWPVYNDVSTQLLYLQTATGGETGDPSYRWTEYGDEVIFEAFGARCGDPVRLATSAVAFPSLGAASGLGAGVLILALFFWVRYSGRDLFFIETTARLRPLAVTVLEGLRSSARVVALAAAPGVRHRLRRSDVYENVDLEACNVVESGARVLCEGVDEGLEDSARRLKKLATLEALTADSERTIVLVSERDPIAVLTAFYRLERANEIPHGNGATHSQPAGATGMAESSAPRMGPGEMRRWAKVLSQFAVIPIDRLRGRQSTRHEKSIGMAWVQRELDCDPQLEEIVSIAFPPEHQEDHKLKLGTARRALAELYEASPREACERVLDAAQAYYWALWVACSENEKLVLAHMAQEKFINPKQHAAVRRLLLRGILEREPALRLMNESFALFVERNHDRSDVERWERSARGVGWAQFRWAFGALLAVIAFFLFATQRELFENTLVFLSALAVSVPTVLRLVRPASDSS